MGLEVVIYIGVKPHECETRKPSEPKTIYMKRKLSKKVDNQMYMFTPDNNVEEELIHEWSPYREFYKCDCESENIIELSPGYISCLDIEKYSYFGPYEFQESDRFYLGAYSKFFRCSRLVQILRDCTSDCDGCYGGKNFLETLKKQLAEVKAENSELQKYFDLLDDKDLSNCVVRHC